MTTPALRAPALRGARGWAAVGAALTVAGCGWAVAALWAPWAVDGPDPTVVPDLNGWQWMRYGDVLLLLTVAAVLGFVAVLVFGRPSRSTTWLAGLTSLGLLGAAACGATLVWVLTGLDSAFMDDVLREHSQGAGARRAVEGVTVAAVGVACAMRGARPRRTAAELSPAASPA